MLHTRQSIYLVQTNVLSTSFLMVYSTFDEISTTHCLYNSDQGRCTQYMWNNDMFILWNHISAIFYEDRKCCLHILPKLSNGHIKLIPYSKMNVTLPVQLLSFVGKVLLAYGLPEAAETVSFCSLMD